MADQSIVSAANNGSLVGVPAPVRATLARLERAGAMLAAADTPDELRRLRAEAAAVLGMLKDLGAAAEAVALAAALRLRAERKLGRLLHETVSRGNPDRVSGFVGLPPGVTPKQSSRSQRVAAVPEAVFEAYLAGAAGGA